MKKYKGLEGWQDFSDHMERLPSVSQHKKVPLTEWIDYFLWQGGSFSDVKKRISSKAFELSHKGYNNPDLLFNPDDLEMPHQRSLLGHIAARAMSSGFIIKINGDLIDSSIDELSQLEKAKKNDYFRNFLKKDPFVRIEGYRGDKRSDLPDEPAKKTEKNYRPNKTDIEKALDMIESEGSRHSLDNILDIVEKNCCDEGKSLTENWRIITERNIKIWFAEQ